MAFWFTPYPTVMLDVIRIGCGLSLLAIYGLLGSDLFALYADGGWVSSKAAMSMHGNEWRDSLLFYLFEPWQQKGFLVVFLAACFGFTFGWQTRWMKWLVFVGHVSLMHRNPAIIYGVDNILTSLLWILCLAPIGRALSADRWLQVRNAKRENLTAVLPQHLSPWVCACLRLIQIQMVIFFFVAGAAKLQGDSWWYGHALWYALTNYEYANIPIGWLVEQFWLVNVLTYLTIVLELAYPFLIWGPRRAWLLSEAIALHVGIAVMMGLYAFSFVMIFAHLAFVRREWLAEWATMLKQRMGTMEMIYDGHCAFCKRSMAAFLAFDGLEQITVRDFRTNPSPIVPDEAMEKALHLVTSNGHTINDKAIAGFDAYRYVVARVPGMMWMIPLFYIPWLSRAVGRPIYNWIATHRNVISTCSIDPSVGCAAPAANLYDESANERA